MLAAALITPTACSTGAAGGGGGAGDTVPLSAAAGRWETRTDSNAAGVGRYELYLPRSYDRSRQHMLVVLLHGCLQDPQDIARGTRIAEHADREGFLVLAPEQPTTRNPRKCWNWFDEASHSRGRGGEAAFIASLAKRVTNDEAVDPNRVHITGISAGAAMAVNVVVAYPERFASVAMHSGIPWRAATNVPEAVAVMKQGIPDAVTAVRLGADAVHQNRDYARSVPALIIQGGADAVVNPANARSLTTQWLSMLGTIGHPASYSWERTMAQRDSGVTNGYHWKKASLMGGDIVEFTIDELGHAWSGGSPEGTFTDPKGPDATAEIVRFFVAHPMKSR